MNHIYRLVWNQVSHVWVAVAESARGRGKGATRKRVAAALSLTASVALAAPIGGQLVTGTGNIAQSGSTTVITQASQNLSLSWQSFNIGKQETVTFVQPSVSAIAVNRILDTNGSHILGQLNANGQVYLINPNGILFGPGAQVNVGGLVASTLDLNSTNLDASNRNFGGAGTGSIVNQGTIHAAPGGYVALLGSSVSNQGTITAPLGTVALGAGNAVTLNFNGNSLVKMQIDQSLLNSLADNGGLIRADGGMVVMNAGAKDTLLASVVNNTGVIEARTVENHAGTITLLGGMAAGSVQVGGTLDASAPNGGNGGFIETSAAVVNIANDSRVSTLAAAGKTGLWLIDPVDFTISAGTASQTPSGIGATTLASNLDATNVTIQTDGSTSGQGDILVNANVTKSAAGSTTLTLKAHGDIVLATGVGIASTGGALNVTLNSDSDASGAGAIRLYDNASIVTAGGNIVMGGGSNPLTTAAFSSNSGNGNGIELDAGVHLNAGTGSISLRGQGNDAGSYSDGVRVAGAGTSIIGGDITIVGQGSNRGGSVSRGVDLENGVTVTGSGTVRITGTGGVTGGNNNIGVALYGASTAVAATGTGTLTVTGTGSGTGASSDNYGVYAESGLHFTTGTGALSITGTASSATAVGVKVSSVTSSGNVSIASLSGDLAINDVINWDSNSTLTLAAWRNININQSITATGSSGKLALQYGQGATDGVLGGVAAAYSVNASVNLKAGQNFNTQLGSTGAVKNYTVITSLGAANSTTGTDLQGIRSGLAGNYVLGGNIDASATATWNPSSNFDYATQITSYYNAGFTSIGSPSTSFTGNFDGLGHTITGLTSNQPSNAYMGMFGALGQGGQVRNVGLVDGNVLGDSYTGALVGKNSGTISNSYTTTSVRGASYVGGLVGWNNTGASVNNSYAQGAVNGAFYGGGLVGKNAGNVNNSYALGPVTSGYYGGGLVGINVGVVNNSYAIGPVSGINAGGLIGNSLNGSGVATNSFWDKDTSGNTTSAGGTGKTTAELLTQATYSGWDFSNTWYMVDGSTRPLLRMEYSNTIGNAHQLQLMGMNLAASYTLSNNIDASRTGLVGGISTDVWSSAGFAPISNSYIDLNTFSCIVIHICTPQVLPFTGTLDGLGHTISTLTINRPTSNYVGLFGQTSATAAIRNVGILGTSISGQGWVGAMVGYNGGSLSNSYATGAVTGTATNAGGLVGAQFSGSQISNSYASVNVIGVGDVGGLSGVNDHGTIDSSYATGNVTGNTGSQTGGLVGANYGGTISNAYATGTVTGSTVQGGLIGYNNGTLSNGYWNSDTLASGVGGGTTTGTNLSGLSSSQMQTAANFTGFNFTSTPGSTGNNWVMLDVDGTLNNAGSALGATHPMLASEYATTINNAHQLQLMAMSFGASYTLGGNIAAAVTGLVGGLSTDVWGSSGFVPIGYRINSNPTYFIGSFDGMGHTISGLTVNRPSANNVGLFGYTNTGSAIRNVGLVGGSVVGGNTVGALVGTNDGTATVSNSYATSSVTGTYSVGGLVGGNYGSISDSYATGNVSGSNNWVGGLVGRNYGNNGSVIGLVSNSYATGNVTGAAGSANVGGLLGSNEVAATLSNSYATGTVRGTNEVGGLVGYNQNTITQSYATGQVTGTGDATGGLVGENLGGTVSNSYASGVVSGINNVGGLVGWNTGAAGGTGGNFNGTTGTSGKTASVATSYSTGAVTGTGLNIGSLVGLNAGGNGGRGGSGRAGFPGGTGGTGGTGGSATETNSYASGGVNGSGSAGVLIGFNAPGSSGSTGAISGGVTPASGGAGGQATQSGSTILGSTELWQLASFSNWNIANTGGSGAIWRIYEGHTAPLLTHFMTGLTLADAPDVVLNYNGNSQTGASTSQPGVLGTAATGTNVGFYNGYYSTQQGYDISGGNLTINAAALSAISLNGTRAYDGTADVAASIFTLSGLVQGEDLTLSGVGTVASKNVGTYSVSLGSLALGNGNNGLASNYTFVGGTQTAIITKADLSVRAAAVTKTYDSTLSASGSASIGAIAGAGAGELVLSSGSQAFLDKNAGAGNKTVRASGVSIKDAGGSDVSSNYTIAYTDNTTSTISKADLVVTGLNANGKVYDALTSATLTGIASISKLGSDDVTLGGAAVGTFATKNVGNQGVTVTGNTINGNDAGNYNLLQQTGLTASISKADLRVSGLSAIDKVYDASNIATLRGTATVTALASDVLTLSGIASATFSDKNAANNKAVTVTGVTLAASALSNDNANYNLLQQTGLTANISKADLRVTGLTAVDKVYDASTTATLGGTATVAALASDVVTLVGNASATFADKNAASNKAVTLTGVTLAASALTNDNGNYNLLQQTGLTANISKADLRVSGLSATDKVYDANNIATLGGTATVTALASDVVTLAGNASATFSDKNAGNNKAVTVTGVTLAASALSNDNANYNLLQQTGLSANISKADLRVSGLTAIDKVYDTNNIATLAGTTTVTALASDVVTLAGTASSAFADKNVGNSKAVTVTGVTLAVSALNNDNANYNLLQQTGLTANISKADLRVIGLTAADKVYDASNVATLGGTATVAALASDIVTLSGTANATFADKNAATNKAVTVSGVTLAASSVSNDNANYNLLQQTGLTATISKAQLIYLAAPANFLNGQTPTGLSGSVYGFAGADSLANATSGPLTWSTNSNAASKPGSYAITGSGLSATNYSFSQAAANANALTLVPAIAPEPVRNTATQLASTTASTQASGNPAVLSVSPAITVTETTTVEAPGLATGPTTPPTSKQDKVAAANTSMSIGATGPTLQIVNGGMRLPLAMVNLNE